jgi:hypothetical protein
MLDRIRRIHFKSLGGILALQDQISSTWLEACQSSAEPTPVMATARARNQ